MRLNSVGISVAGKWEKRKSWKEGERQSVGASEQEQKVNQMVTDLSDNNIEKIPKKFSFQ